MSDISVDPPTATRAANQLAPAAGLAADSASGILTIACAQDTAKWGTEAAPAAFKRSYADALMDAYAEVKVLEQQLTSYVAAIHHTVAAFQQEEDDAVARQAIVDAKIQQEAYENAPPAPNLAPAIPQAQ